MRRSGLIVLAAAAFVVVALALRQPAPPPQVIEDAYRANNVGVARLEQFDYTAAAEAFRTALRLSPSLALARVNLAIALFYALDLDGAQHEIEEAARLLPRDPRPPYVLGLIARAQGRLDAAREAFKRVRELDPRDVGTLINAGQIDLQERREADAISAFRAALNEEPYNVTASYNLGLALTRSGRRDEGQKVMEESQAVRASGYGTIFSTNYLEQGHYAEAMTSTGAEPDLADRAIPDVTFAATAIGLSVAQSTAPIQSPFGRRFSSADLADDGRAIADAVAGGVTAFDYDGDGDSDLLVVRAGDARLLRNDRGAFADVTRESGIGSLLGSGAIAAVAGDYDNDGAPDLFVIRYGRNLLLHNDGGGRFSDVTAQSGLPAYRFLSTSAAFVDFDHDGDLDIVIVGLADLDRAREGAAARALTFPDDFPGAPAVLLQNNGNGTFTDITGKTGVSGLRHGVAIVPTDYDNRRDVDLLIASYDGTPALFTNLRDGTFRDDASKVGIAIEGRVTSVAAADFNKDDFTDFFFGRASAPGVFAISDGRGRFRMVPAPEATAGALAAQFVDYDNDGVIDLLTWSADGPRLLRGGAGEWSDVTARAFGGTASGASAPRSARAALAADVDGDGDMDVIASDAAAGNVAVWRNDGGSRNASMRVRLTARVSNRSALGAKIDLRAGSLRQRLESSSSAPPAVPADILFGLGRRRGADVVRVLWPSGILQAEAANSTSNTSNTGAVLTSPMIVEELNRKPSSCPFLFTWNGRRFEFVTDFMGGGEMGYWEAPGVRNKPDPEEYVRISDEQLQPKDGRYELRITNELEETMFVDRLSLLAVTHRRDEEVFPNEGMTDPPKPFRLFQAREIGPPPRVTDDRGHDVTARIAAVDGAYPDDFRLSPIRGYAAPHALTIALGAVRPSLLLLTGWTDYAFSSDNVAADQAGLALQPPALEARGADGRWRTIVADIGIPVGRPQTIVVDLKGRLAAGTTDVRIVTNMRIYWDRILFANQADGGAQIDRLEPAAAVLRTRGFSAELTPKSPQPITYDYQRVTRISPWKTMVGTYTREGNVLPLLMRTDDQFVIAGPGDEIALSFDAGKLPPLEPGFTRTFLLHADGFSKEMDLHSASPDAVAPLPFHGMRRYPYAPSDAPPDTPEKERYRTEYNTRRVMRQLPPLNGTELPSRDHRRER